MERHDVINSLSRGRFQDYLEIGVDYGTTFNKVDIARKVGVDPNFKVPVIEIFGETYAGTSDAYFEEHSRHFDCVFVDGLHTYEQSKRDFLNGWKALTAQGVVVIDDCFPVDDLSALPDVSKCLEGRKALGTPENMTWMGDVYKTVLWINDFTDYTYAYVTGAQGIVVVWQKRVAARKRLLLNEFEIANCSFQQFRTFDMPFLPIGEISRQVASARPTNLFKTLLGIK